MFLNEYFNPRYFNPQYFHRNEDVEEHTGGPVCGQAAFAVLVNGTTQIAQKVDGTTAFASSVTGAADIDHC